MRTFRVSTRSLRFPARRRSALKGGILLWAILAQIGILGTTILIVVRDPPEQEAPVFSGGQKIEKKVAPPPPAELRRLLRRSSRPNFAKRLTTQSLVSDPLPALPELPKDAFDFEGADLQMMEDAQGMLEQTGFLNAGRRSAAASSAAALFGVQDSGRRIVVIVNTSASVVRKARNAGVSIERLHEEVIELINGLQSSTLFGIVQFSQGSRRFAPHLAPAITRNREAATDWIRAELRGNPPVGDEELVGHEAGLALALDLEPDVIFLITDGSLNKRVRISGELKYPEIPYGLLMESIEKKMRASGRRARIHAIGFKMKEKDRRGMAELTRKFGGTLREF